MNGKKKGGHDTPSHLIKDIKCNALHVLLTQN